MSFKNITTYLDQLLSKRSIKGMFSVLLLFTVLSFTFLFILRFAGTAYSGLFDQPYLTYLVATFIVFFAIFLILIYRRVYYPIRELNKTASRLKRGDLTARLPKKDVLPPEYNKIWENFNAFAKNSETTIQELQLIFDNADIGITWVKDRHYLTVNNKLLDIFGYSREEFIGKSTRLAYCNDEDFERVAEGYELLSKGKTFSIEILMPKKDGSTFWCNLTGRSTGSSDDSSVWLFEDISKRKVVEEKLYTMANYDSLTSLANRNLFNIYLKDEIAKSHRQKRSFAIMFVDLDRFKQVNDSLGHDAGDEVLRQVALRMKNVLRESDIVARLSGDEFTIIIGDVSDTEGLVTVANNLLNELAKVFKYGDSEVYIGASIGISRYPSDSKTLSDLMSFADSAMYVAKNSGRNTFRFYSEHIGGNAEKFTALSQGLHKAVERDEFELHYQTKVKMETQEVIGCEALIRWNKPNQGLVSPFEFISVLEESGLMVQVGEWVIFEACRAIKKWEEVGVNVGKVAINLSGRQFGSGSLLRTVKQALEETGVLPEQLEFEITESLMMDDASQVVEILNSIQKLGIHIAIDDFGTGYSSLAYLKKFPIDILKIDRAFIKDITEDEDSAAIVDAIIAMAKQLNLKTVAEGIETKEQYALLANKGCEVGQGYLFSKPVSFDEMIKQFQAVLK